MNELMRDIGTLAQIKLEEWAAQVSITSNVASKDKEGWDYLLQFPLLDFEIGKPLDLRPARIECLVQVKGIETEKKTKSIKLSNWEKLVSSPLPAFFLIVQYGEEDDPENAFLVEVDDKWIYKVMERLRKVPDEKKNQLHKMRINLMWADSNRIEKLNGEGLKTSIEKLIGDDYDAYVTQKHKYKKEVGQEAPFVINITSMPYETLDSIYKDWVDLAIGVKDELPLAKMIINKEIRFGIPAETIEEKDGYLSIIDRSKTSKPITLILRNEKGTRKSSFPASLFTPDHFFPGKPVPKEIRKVRITSEIGDFVFNPNAVQKEKRVTVKIKYDENPRKLSELANLWRIVLILDNALDEGCYFEISDEEHDPFCRQISGKTDFPREFKIVSFVVENALFLAKALNIPTEIEVTLDQLLNQLDEIIEIRKIFDQNFPINTISGTIAEDKIPFQGEQAVIIAREISLGSIKIIIIFGFAGTAGFPILEEPGKFEIPNPRRIHFSFHHMEDDEIDPTDRLLNEVSDKLEETGYFVILLRD